MIPNYIVITAASAEDLQKKINEKAKEEAGGYRPINLAVGSGFAVLMEAKIKN
jgi:hypothetical protein